MAKNATSYRFGPFRLETEKHRLVWLEQEIDLRPKAFETLLYLVQHPGRLVEKEELLTRIWSGTVVSETTLSHCIEEIRTALNDDAHNPTYIKTMHRLGYKFITQVSTPQGSAVSVSPKKLTARKRGLSYLLAALILFFTLLLIWFFFLRKTATIDSLAVLPFVNLSSDSGQEYFEDTMTDALIARLAGLKGLRVISRTSSMQYKGVKKPLPGIAHELGVDAVVEGSINYDSSRVRVIAQLILARKEEHLWAETYERKLEDLWTLHDELASAIARAVSDRLSLNLLPQHKQADPRAYKAYLKGRYLVEKRREECFLKALEYFQQAVQLQPHFAAPYAGMANCYNMLANYDMQPPNEVAPSAKSAAAQALALDENLGEAHAALGFTAMFYDWDWLQAETCLHKAVELNANSSEAHHWLALLYTMQDRFPQALQEIKIAEILDPVSLIINTNEGWLYYFQRKYDQAETKLKSVSEMDPEFLSAHIKRGWVLQQTGREKEAVEVFDRVCIKLENDQTARAMYSDALALAGEKEKALKILNEIIDPAQQRYYSSYHIACIYIALGEYESAWTWLVKAYEQHSGWLAWLALDPKMDPLRGDPRFAEMVKRMGLVQHEIKESFVF